MDEILSALVHRLDTPPLTGTGVIPWSCPVPVFGDLSKAVVATLGLNPSNREFVDDFGKELDGPARRLHTLKSLRLNRWSEAGGDHVELIRASCESYFAGNPYNTWFRSLDSILSAASLTYYGSSANACHLDLIPYATTCKWTKLPTRQRSALLSLAGDTLGRLVRDSEIRLLLLNGRTVVESMQSVAGVTFGRTKMHQWTLPRKVGSGVAGFAFRGAVSHLSGIDLGREVLLFGYNHNIQSSFGVTASVKTAIRRWFAKAAKGLT